tara:strand:- start:865 stop:1311 length:447 start_codon:yes stop_codon:yes gene_type:complete
MIETVFDIESDGLLNEITKIHVVSYIDEDMDKPKSLFSREDITSFFGEDRVFIGHYITGFDLEALRMIYGIQRPPRIVDTYPLALALMPDRDSYGLASFGDKPEVTDWSHQPLEVYTERCEADVINNWDNVWVPLRRKLGELYGYTIT